MLVQCEGNLSLSALRNHGLQYVGRRCFISPDLRCAEHSKSLPNNSSRITVVLLDYDCFPLPRSQLRSSGLKIPANPVEPASQIGLWKWDTSEVSWGEAVARIGFEDCPSWPTSLKLSGERACPACSPSDQRAHAPLAQPGTCSWLCGHMASHFVPRNCGQFFALTKLTKIGRGWGASCFCPSSHLSAKACLRAMETASAQAHWVPVCPSRAPYFDLF